MVRPTTGSWTEKSELRPAFGPALWFAAHSAASQFGVAFLYPALYWSRRYRAGETPTTHRNTRLKTLFGS
jgi:hypothetical protein